MTCTFNREQLALFVNRDATPEEREVTARHLTGCEECQAVVGQYQSMVSQVAGTFVDDRPARGNGARSAYRPWRVAAVAAAVMFGLLGVMQVPAVAAQVARVFPFMQVFELDKNGVSAFIHAYMSDTWGEPIYPELYDALPAAEAAWGGKIPQPTALVDGMELYRIEMYKRESGFKDVTLRYKDTWNNRNLSVRIANRAPQRKVPAGATSETMVNGQVAVVIKGTFSQYAGQRLTWDPDSDIELLFPLGELYGQVSTIGTEPGFTVADLVTIAESIR